MSLLLTAFLVCHLTLAPLANASSHNHFELSTTTATAAATPTDTDRVWQMTGPFGGDVSALTVDPRNPNRILIGGSDGQMFSSTDGGTIWKRMRPGIRALGFIVTVIQFDREKPNLIYAGAKPQTEVGDENNGGGFFISEDDGSTWREIESMRGRAVRSFSQSLSEPSMMAIAASNGIYSSSDRGNNWRLITPVGNPELRGFHSVAVDPRDANAIYVGTHHLPWKTLDGGKTWKRTGYKEIGMIDDSDIFTIQIDPENPNTVLMSACSGIYRSRDAGTGWTKFQGIPYSSRRTHMIYRHPTRPETIFAATTEGLWVSTADGKQDSWRQVTSAQLVINAVAVHPAAPDRVFLATQDHGVLISLNSAESFEVSNAGFISRQVRTVLADRKERGRVYAGVLFDGLNGGLFVSEDGGITWQQSMKGMGVRDVYSLSQSPTNPEVIYAGTNHGLFRSEDHGRNWTHLKREEPVEVEPVQKVEDKPVIEAPKPATRPRIVPGPQQKKASRQNSGKQNSKAKSVKPIVQARGKKAAPKSKPAPVAKKKVEPPPKPVSDRVDLQNQIFSIIPFTARLENGVAEWVIVSTWDGLLFTDDETKGWKPFKIRLTDGGELNQPIINGFATSPHAPGVIFIATHDGLFLSRDNGGNFQRVAFDEEIKNVRSVMFDPRSGDTVYLGTVGGFFRSVDGGKTWEQRGGGMPQMVNVGGLVVSGANADELYLLDEIRLAVFHSRDRGKNWDKMDVGQLPSLKMLTMVGDPFDSNRLYAGSYSGGVYVMSRK
ncbi:MAG: WD40/YVTN/BNR-like repeat-containing protein [Blastocatellia bacterium]